MAEITGITLGREREENHGRDASLYDGPADGAASAHVEIGLRAAQSGDSALAYAQVFALPPHARDEYRGLIEQIIALGRKPGRRLDPFGSETLRRIERDAA